MQRTWAGPALRVEIDTGHHPFLSRPELLAGVLASTLERGTDG